MVLRGWWAKQEKGFLMASKRVRSFDCTVINEKVQIYLRDKQRIGLQSEKSFFVQCDQEDCQYVEENKLPCPLDISLFAEDILKREEDRRKRRENG
jgi:hypothetical protein